MPFKKKKDRPYQKKEWLQTTLEKYELVNNKVPYSKILKDNNLEAKEVSALKYYIDKFRLSPESKNKSSKFYSNDEDRINAIRQSQSKYVNKLKAENISALYLNKFPVSLIEEIKKIKKDKTYTEYFIDLHKKNIEETLSV